MTNNSFCKKLKRTCSNLKTKCTSKLGLALGRFANAKKCKKALRSDANKKVGTFCKKKCGSCGKFNQNADKKSIICILFVVLHSTVVYLYTKNFRFIR